MQPITKTFENVKKEPLKSNEGDYHKHLFFNIFLTGIITICFFVLMTDIVGANPAPTPKTPPGDQTGGGPAFYGNCTTRFVSENVTVYLDEQAYIEANYTFHNPLNHSVYQGILLPFHYSSRKPTGVIITLDGEMINYSWEPHEFREWSFNFSFDSPYDQEFYSDLYDFQN